MYEHAIWASHTNAKHINWVLESVKKDTKAWERLGNKTTKPDSDTWLWAFDQVKHIYTYWQAVSTDLWEASGGNQTASFVGRAAILALLASDEAGVMLETGMWIPGTPVSRLMICACVIQADEDKRPLSAALWEALCEVYKVVKSKARLVEVSDCEKTCQSGSAEQLMTKVAERIRKDQSQQKAFAELKDMYEESLKANKQLIASCEELQEQYKRGERMTASGNVQQLKARILELEKACEVKDKAIASHKETRSNLTRTITNLENKLSRTRTDFERDQQIGKLLQENRELHEMLNVQRKKRRREDVTAELGRVLDAAIFQERVFGHLTTQDRIDALADATRKLKLANVESKEELTLFARYAAVQAVILLRKAGQ